MSRIVSSEFECPPLAAQSLSELLLRSLSSSEDKISIVSNQKLFKSDSLLLKDRHRSGPEVETG